MSKLNVTVPWQQPTPAARTAAVEEDWSAVYVPATESPRQTTPREIATLASLWGRPEPSVVSENTLEDLWISDSPESEIEFTPPPEPFPSRTASARPRYPDATNIRAIREAAREGTHLARSARQAFAEASRVLRSDERVAEGRERPETPPAPKKTPMQRAAEITSQSTAYDRLLNDD